MKTNRRSALKGGSLALASLTAGTLTSFGCNAAASAMNTTNSQSVASFGWEVANLNGNGANAYFTVSRNMILNSINIDVAFMITALPAVPGFAEVLCQAGVFRGMPSFNGAPGSDYLPVVASSDFGPVTVQNPNNLTVHANQSLAQDIFFSVILKSWVPVDGSASAASRRVAIEPSLALNVGDVMMFHMDHAGVPVDAEMQVVLGYGFA
jgi:hypothetical protein